MANLIVRGGRPLRGRVIPSANKNAVLPILCATLLTDQPVTLRGVSDITDARQNFESVSVSQLAPVDKHGVVETASLLSLACTISRITRR